MQVASGLTCLVLAAGASTAQGQFTGPALGNMLTECLQFLRRLLVYRPAYKASTVGEVRVLWRAR